MGMMSILAPDGSTLDRNGNGGMPWQVKALATIGVPSVLALGLSWFLVQEVRAGLRQQNLSLDAHIGQMERDAEAARYRDSLNRMFLRQLCWNTSRSPQQARACDEIGR